MELENFPFSKCDKISNNVSEKQECNKVGGGQAWAQSEAKLPFNSTPKELIFIQMPI